MKNEPAPSQLSEALANLECPLLDLIVSYRAALDDFNQHAPEDNEGAEAYSAETFWPAMREIEQHDQPALSLRSAIEAVRLARDELALGDSTIAAPLLKAALSFFDGIDCRPDAAEPTFTKQ